MSDQDGFTKQSLKVPPHDVNAEKSVLGAILIDPSAMSMVAEIVNQDNLRKNYCRLEIDIN